MELPIYTVKHMKKIKLLDENHDITNESVINLLMRLALDWIPELYFVYLFNAYRWKILDGTIDQDSLTYFWVKMRNEYLGLIPPVMRDEDDLDFGVTSGIDGKKPQNYFRQT